MCPARHAANPGAVCGDSWILTAPRDVGGARSHGSADPLTSNTVSDPDGSRDAPSGPIQVRGPAPRFEHVLYWTTAGSGAYAGLTCHGLPYFPETHAFVPGDESVWSGWMEEAT